MMRYLAYVMFSKVGWFMLHAVAIAGLFLLGYSMDFSK
jgi:hypothetical protein